jgi:hypothetical protein
MPLLSGDQGHPLTSAISVVVGQYAVTLWAPSTGEVVSTVTPDPSDRLAYSDWGYSPR